MANYTETTTRSYGSRLGSSFGGIGAGFLLFCAGTGLLWWNEGNFVHTRDALNEARRVSVELASVTGIDPAANGKLAHATGMAETGETLRDPLFGVSGQGIRLERRVEFYQWTEHSRSEKRQKPGGGEETITTYSYTPEWVSAPVDSQQFRDPEARTAHANPRCLQAGSERFQAQRVNLGAYILPDFLISRISGEQPLTVQLSPQKRDELTRAVLRTRPELGRGAIRQPRLAIEEGNTLYLGASPLAPQAGDMRVSFTLTPPAQVSVLAQVNGNTFVPYKARNGKTISGLSMGSVTMEEMFGAKQRGNEFMRWVLRALGTGLVVGGLKTMLAPLAVLASVLPVLGRITAAGAGMFSTILGTAWALVVVAVAWLRFRPLAAGAMLATAAVLTVFAFLRGRKADKIMPPPGPLPPMRPPAGPQTPARTNTL